MDLKSIHHIGRVVPNIEKELAEYRRFGFSCDQSLYNDPIQKVKIGLVHLGDEMLLELLEPDGKESPITNFLAKGGGLHHICYRVHDLEKTRQEMSTIGVVLTKPAPSIFGGKKVFFFYSRTGEIIECIEE